MINFNSLKKIHQMLAFDNNCIEIILVDIYHIPNFEHFDCY